jgi:cytochrome oxidase Cu insertion factor (SCO1/SenC/PrrC family)
MRQRQRETGRPRARPPVKVVFPGWLIALSVVVVALATYLGAGALRTGPAPASEPAPDAGRAPDFAVATTSGSTFRLSDQQGKAVLLFFTGPG